MRQMTTDRLAALVEHYVGSTREKAAACSTAVHALATSNWADADALAELFAQVHQLSGSGGSMGYPELGSTAAALEVLLRPAADEGEPVGDEVRAQVQALVAYLERLAEAMRPEQSQMLAQVDLGFMGLGGARRVVLMDGLAEDDRAELTQQLTSHGFVPQPYVGSYQEDTVGIVVDATERSLEPGVYPAPLVVISGRRDLGARVEAFRAGAVAYLCKPVDPGLLLDALDRLRGEYEPEPARVLIVESDLHLAEFYAYVLARQNVLTDILAEPDHLLRRMDEFRPDLVLMEQDLPVYSGLELAGALRQIAKYDSVPIVFLSREARLDSRSEALASGGDDVLFKPIQPDYLVGSVLGRVRRSRTLRALMTRDALTGIPAHGALMVELDRELGRARRTLQPLALAMIHIEGLKEINRVHGHAFGDRVIQGLARLLKQRLRQVDAVGRLGGGSFGVILTNSGQQEAELVMEQIKDAFRQLRWRVPGNGEIGADITSGVACYPELTDLKSLRLAADHALHQARYGKPQDAVGA